MIKRLSFLISIFMLLILNSTLLFSQASVFTVFVSVDLNTGNVTVLDTIDGFEKSPSQHEQGFALNQKDGIYSMVGLDYRDSNSLKYDSTFLYSIDVSSGNVISRPKVPLLGNTGKSERIRGLVYHNFTGELYALHRTKSFIGSNPVKRYKLVKINPISGNYISYNTIEGLDEDNFFGNIDGINNRYYFVTYSGSIEKSRCLTLNDGKLYNTANIKRGTNWTKFSNRTGYLYGIYYGPSYEYVILDPLAGGQIYAKVLPGFPGTYTVRGSYDFDEGRNRFIYHDKDDLVLSFKYIDSTGSVFSYPTLKGTTDVSYYDGLTYDNNRDRLYFLGYYVNPYVGIKNVNNISLLSIYPNPSRGELHLNTNGNTPYKLQLFNAQGKLVFEKYIQNSGTVTVDIPKKLKDGVYIINLITNNSVLTQKLILQRN